MQVLPEVEENIQIYEEVIFNLCNLLIELGISDNPIEIFETFRYMYHQGYLSIQPYSDRIPDNYIALERNGFIAMDITGTLLLTGYGVCRHTTDFLSYIYHALGYENSILSTYHPDLRVNVIVRNPNFGFLSNPEGQKYIDETIANMNLFGSEEVHITRNYGDIDVVADYYPSEQAFNHIMNIVKRKENDTVHIVDTRYHCVGERINDSSIRLNNSGLTHIDFVNQTPMFPTYYDTDYQQGLKLLQKQTDIDEDVRNSIIYREFCKRYKKRYEEFKTANQENYKAVSENYKKLIKKLN